MTWDDGEINVEFEDPWTKYLIAKALLRKEFNVEYFEELVEGEFIPGIQGWVEYIDLIHDLLIQDGNSGLEIKGIDLNGGSWSIYSMIGCRKYGWKFISITHSKSDFEMSERHMKEN